MSSDPKTVVIRNVRLSFPNLFRPSAAKGKDGQPQGEPVFSSAFILDKKANAADIKALEAAVALVKKEKWQGKPVNMKNKSIRDGAEKAATEGYGDAIVFISARNKRRPMVVDRNPTVPIVEGDPRLFAGCYVNAEVSAWAQDNQFGKGVNWSLNKVQYVREGDPFGEGQRPVEESFSNLEEDNSAV